MATRNITGIARRRVRLDGNRPRTHPKPASREAGEPPAKAALADDRPERQERAREQLFKAMSIVACCRLACASSLDEDGDAEVMVDALQAAHDFIDVAAAALDVSGGSVVAAGEPA
jgi:hypothetical protein